MKVKSNDTFDKRKRRKKVRGLLGISRMILQSSVVALLLISLLVNGCLIGTGAFVGLYIISNGNPFVGLVGFLLATFGSLVLIVQIGYRRAIRKIGFYARPITKDEYARLSGFNLIHYTDYLNQADIETFENTGNIQLIGNGNRKSNYSMLPKDRHDKFVWFHLSDNPGSEEPKFDSFWFSHSGESSQRAYKIILPCHALPKDRLLYRPFDGAVVLRGDYNGECQLKRSFEWYNDRIYFLKSLHFTYAELFFTLYVGFVQLKEDFYMKRKKTVTAMN